MTHTIHKFPVDVTDNFTLKLPQGCKILDVQVQGANPYIWVLLDPMEPRFTHHFRVIGTGHDIDDVAAKTMTHIGTFQLIGGKLVFHLFLKPGIT